MKPPRIDHIGIVVDELEPANAAMARMLPGAPLHRRSLPEARLEVAEFHAENLIVELLRYTDGGERLDADYIVRAAANASLMAFTRSLGGNSTVDGVRVIGVNPGPVATDRLVGLMRREIGKRFGDRERWQALAASYAVGRAATVDEIAATVVLLTSDHSSYTTGTNVTIDDCMANRGSLI